MGNQICCSQNNAAKQKTTYNVVTKKNSDTFKQKRFLDTFSTSDDSSQPQIKEIQSKIQIKVSNPKTIIIQPDFQLSSIQNISQPCQDCGEQRLFICYFQKLQKQIQAKYRKSQSNKSLCFLNLAQRMKLDQKKFIQHSNKCPTCFELLQNLMNIQNISAQRIQQNQDQNRISLRDSLLEFLKDQKVKRSAQCKCPTLNSSQEAKKAMKKYPHTNKYQIKKQKFRKTSLFQPEIHQGDQSQSSQEM